MSTIAIVDYGMGNLFSVAHALQAAAPAAEVFITRDSSAILQAERVVLPGQGAMPDCMQHLQQSGLLPAVLHAAANKPLLGICVGEQMLFDSSEEGPSTGLGLFPGSVRRFDNASSADFPQGKPQIKVPHVGWNRVHQCKAHPLWHNIDNGAYFYFVHSYFADPAQEIDIAARSYYGVGFTCAVAKANIFAVQFHPEKSADNGLQLFRNFTYWKP